MNKFHSKAALNRFRRRRLWVEQLEARRLLIGSDWTNVLNSLNADGDAPGSVSPLDALVIINELNDPRFSNPRTGELPIVGNSDSRPPPFLDVDCDSRVTPLDVLNVINALNGGPRKLSWRFAQQGGSPNFEGRFSADSCSPKLEEGTSFITSLVSDLVVPTDANLLTFETMSLLFDSASQGRPLDAFEASLLNENGRSLVKTLGTGRDSFFNVSEGLSALKTSDVSAGTNTVSLSLVDVLPGTKAQLVLRLVNNDGDTKSSVVIPSVRFETSSQLVSPSRLMQGPLPPTSNSSVNSSTQTGLASLDNFQPPGPDVIVGRPTSNRTNNQPILPLAPILPAGPSNSPPLTQSTINSRGKEFWIGFPDNLYEGNRPQKLLYVTGDVATTGYVEIPGLVDPNTTKLFRAEFVVNAGEVTTVELPSQDVGDVNDNETDFDVEVELVARVQHKGIHVVTQEPVAVYGLDLAVSTSDAFLALPVSSLGKEYINLGYENTYASISHVEGTQFLVVAAQDDTQVTLQPGPYSGATTTSNAVIRRPNGSTDFYLGNSVGSDIGPYLTEAAGIHSLTVNAPFDGYSGNYNFELVDVATAAASANIEEKVTVPFPTGRESKVVSFDVQAGQRLYYDAMNPSPPPKVSVRILSASGEVAEITSQTDNNSFANQYGSLLFRETGKYYFLITGEQSTTFNFTFRLIDMDSAPRITLGTDYTSEVNPAGRAEIYRLDGNAGQILYNDTFSSNRLILFTIIGPGGQTILSTTAADDSVFVLPETNTYYIVLDSASFAPSSFGFRILDLNSAPVLPLASPTNSVVGTGHLNAYRFAGSATQTFNFDIQSVTPPIRASFQLFDPTGNAIPFFESNNKRSAKMFSSGNYTLLIGALAIQEGGTVAILPTIVDDQIVTKSGFNTNQSLAILAGGSATYSFSAPAGTRMLLDGLNVASADLNVEFNAPDGARLYTGFGLANDVQDVPRFGPAQLPQSGTYTLTVRGNSPTATGIYNFRVLDLDNAGTPLTLGTLVNGNFPNGREALIYTIDANVGDQLLFDGRSGNFIFGIYDQSLRAIYSRGINGAAFTHEVDGVGRVLQSGRHYVLFQGDLDIPRDFSFQIQNLKSSPSLALGTEATGAVAANGEIAYRMQLTSGQRIRFDNLLPFAGEINYRIANAGGRVLFDSGFQNFDSGPPGIRTIFVPESGEYFLFIQSAQATPGSYRFRFDDLASVPLLTFNTDLEVTLNPGNAARVFRIDAEAGETIQIDNLGSPLPLNWDISGPISQFRGGNDGSDFSAMILSTGTHFLTISGHQDTGPITIRFRAARAASPVTPLAGFNTVVNWDVSLNETKTYSFSAPTGRLIYLNVMRSDFAIRTQTVTLNQGETYLLRDLAEQGPKGAADLTGSIIISTKPVAVFGGNRAAFVPSQFFAADHLVEQLPPTNTWGRKFVTMPLATGSARGDRFRFLAQSDSTQVSVNGTVVTTLDRGQFFEQVITGPSQITSTRPILVAQYAHSQNYYRTDPGGNPAFQGDPLMMIVPPAEQFLASYTVSTPQVSAGVTAQRFDRNYINIVAPNEVVGQIEIDGVPIPANQFIPIGSSGFSGTQYAVSLGAYSLAGPLPFGVFVYGFGSFDSYGYVGGQALSSVATASSIVLTPSSANPRIGNSLGLKARVADVSGAPLAGIRVDFDVSGVNPQRGFGFSDVNGLVEFSYTGSRDGRDIVTASVGPLLDDSIVDWRSNAVAPQVYVAAPIDGSSITAGATLVASGFALADFPLATLDLVTVNGTPVTSLDAAGNFFVSLFVGPGDNEFEFSAVDSNGQLGTKLITIRGTQPNTSQVDFTQFAEVTGSFKPTYARSYFHQSTRSHLAETSVENVGQFPADVPLLVGIANISDPMVLVRHADGQTPDGVPYYDFTGLVTGGSLNPHGRTGLLLAEFFNPNQSPFTYDLIFFGKLNEPPQIMSLPPTQVDLNREYRYDVIATDPNHDAIAFELAEAPSGMTIDTNNGKIRWIPTDTDIGLHTVDIRASDTRLGQSNQRFVLSARPAPSNRSPAFTSLPIAIAEVGKPYGYLVEAKDADGDPLTFRLVSGPTAMTISAVGELRWQPTPGQLGKQNVSVEVLDARGATALQTFSLRVLSPTENNSPVIVSSPPTAIKLGPFAYQVIARDADNESLSYRLVRSSAGMSISPTGLIEWVPSTSQLGAHAITIEVLDTRGGRDSQSFSLAVFDDADPIITSQPITTSQLNSAYRYQLTATDSIDDLLSFKLLSAPIGMTIQVSSGLVQWNVTKSSYAQEPVVVEVADGRGGIAIQRFTIGVAGGQSQSFNTNPFFISTPPTVASVGTTFVYPVQARDPDGDPMTFDLPLGPRGMVIDAATGRLGWLPRPDQAGMQQVVIRVRDSRDGVGLVSFKINVDSSNTSPVITSSPILTASVNNAWEYRLHVQDSDNDSLMFELASPTSGMTLTRLKGADSIALLSFTPTVPGPLNVHLIVSDSRGGRSEQRFTLQVSAASPNIAPIIQSSPRLTIPAGQPWIYLISVEDPNGDPITINAPAKPEGMSLNSNLRALNWTPTLAELGSHSVTLNVADGRGGIASQTLSVNVVAKSENHNPTIVSPPSAYRATIGEPFAYDLRSADEDSDPVEWKLLESPHGASLDQRFGTLRWTPALDQLGQQRFVISAKDPLGLEALQSFSLIVSGTNLAPSILSRPPSEAVAEDRFVYGIRAVDPENDFLTFAIVTGPAGMTIDSARGIVRWTPTLGQLGAANATIEVSDSRGNKSTQSFPLNVTQIVRNREPIITSRANFRARVDALYQYDVNAVDPEGNAIQYSLVAAPSGMQIDQSSGLITWTPTTAQAGSHLVQVAAQDTAGGRSIQRFAIQARINRAPIITSTALTSVAVGGTYHYDVQVTDADSDAVSYGLVTGPVGMSIDSLGRVVWPTALGVALSNPVALRVTDSFGATATQTFSLAVTPDTTAPRVDLQLSANPLVLGGNTVILVQASDNVDLADIRLTMNGRLLVLDANHSLTLRGDSPGLFSLQAIARDTSGNEAIANAVLRVFDPSDTRGPTILITSPQANATITKLTDIVGSITDDNLQFYRIDYGRADLVDVNHPEADDANFKTLATGNLPAIDRILATFDPTLLLNDDYVLRIFAKDLSGNISTVTIPISLRGDLKLGDLNLDFTDLVVPLAGIPIRIGRNYKTLQRNESGDFGFGWSLSIADPIIRESIPVNPLEEQGLFFAATPFKEGTRVYLTNPEGRRVGFTFAPTSTVSFFGGGSFTPRFVPDPGVQDALDVGSEPLRRINGAFYSGFFGVPFNPSAYRLTSKSGVVYEYGQFEGLDNIHDLNGNRLGFSSNGITSSNGSSIQFVRDPAGRIEKIIDPAGNAISYRYGIGGDLLSFQDQAGLKTQYAYLSNSPHFLDAITDPRGKLIFQSHFDAQGRLTSSTDALGNSVLNTYDPVGLSESVTDATGKTTKLTFDDRGNVLSVKDPAGAVRSYTYDSANNALSATDPLGNQLKRLFDERGNIVSMTDPLGNVSTSTFASNNQVSSATDAMGNTGTLIYNDRGQLVQFINAIGQSSFNKYDTQGRKTSYVDNMGSETRYEYGNGPRPTKVLFADGKTSQFVYDPQDRITHEVDEQGNETTYTYDPTGRPLSKRDALGGLVQTSYVGPSLDKIVNAKNGVSRFEYDDAGRRIKEIDANGDVTVNQYNGNNQLAKRIDPLGHALQYDYRPDGRVDSVTDALGHKTVYGYDVSGNRTSVTDANGNVWRYEYDAMGRVVKKCDVLGSAESYAYDSVGRLTSVTDRSGGVLRYEYDALGRVVRLIDPLGGVLSATFYANGQLKSLTDALGNVTRLLYDLRGRLSQTTDAAGGKRTSTYDDSGNLIAQTDELDQMTHYEYDALHRLIQQTDPLGNRTTNAYDASGNTVASTDPLGRTTTFAVDSMNQLLSTTDPQGSVTRYAYDAAGHRTSVTDPLGQITRFQYDADNRLVNRIDPLGNASTISYDAVGNLKQTVDRNSRQRSYVYDPNNQLIREDWLSPSGSVVHSIATTYEADGQIASSFDTDSAYTYSYDAIGRVTKVDNIGTPNSPRLALNYRFDALGNRLSTSDNLGVHVDATYNNRNLLASQTWSGTGIAPIKVDLQYNAKRQLTSLQRYSDATGSTSVGKTIQTFDASGRLTSLSHRNAIDAILSEYGYTYDLASQLVSETHGVQSSEYSYDLAGQLKSASNSTRPNQAFNYDLNGNRAASNIVMGANNRIESDGQFAYAFDKEGNMIRKTNNATQNNTRYSYDYRNRLTLVSETTAAGTIVSQVRYTYDVFDRRISVDTGSEVQYSVYDRDRVWADFQADGSIAARYLYGPNVDELLARQRPGEGVSWYLTDRLGSVRDIADAAGAIVDHIEYDAFGGIAFESNPQLGDRFKYTGREWDTVSGLYNYRARYYMPALGIFMSEDPIGFCAGDANLRRYVGNRVTNATDPSGMQAIAEFGADFAAQLDILVTLIEFGGDDAYTFRVGGRAGGVAAGLDGDFTLGGTLEETTGFGIEFNVTNPGKTKPTFSPGTAATANGDGGIANKVASFAGNKAWTRATEPEPKREPFADGEFQFLVESTAYKKSYFDHYLARFNVAIFGGVAEELNLIAKVAVADDATKLVEVRDQAGIWEGHGFAVITPRRSKRGGQGNPDNGGPPPPDGGFGFAGTAPSPGAGNSPDGDGDDSDVNSSGGCCSDIYFARSYLAFAYVQNWNEPTLVRLGRQVDSDDFCVHFADQQFVYAKAIRRRLNTNR